MILNLFEEYNEQLRISDTFKASLKEINAELANVGVFYWPEIPDKPTAKFLCDKISFHNQKAAEIEERVG